MKPYVSLAREDIIGIPTSGLARDLKMILLAQEIIVVGFCVCVFEFEVVLNTSGCCDDPTSSSRENRESSCHHHPCTASDIQLIDGGGVESPGRRFP